MERLVCIDVETGEVSYIDDPETAALVADVCGEQASKQRASHVEPVSRPRRFLFHLCRRLFGESGRVATWTRSNAFGPWRVNLAPVNGPVLATVYADRSQAIAAEVAWLVEHPENWI